MHCHIIMKYYNTRELRTWGSWKDSDYCKNLRLEVGMKNHVLYFKEEPESNV